MFNFNANNYLNNITQTPHEHYHDLIQATVDSQWNNTTLLDYIKEENIPFDGEYTKQEVWVDTISDVTVNTLKVIGNYINVTFKDIDHPRNYRGQKYKWKEKDRDYESTYLCYDMISSSMGVAETKLIKCNNSIKIIDKNNGYIHEEPIFVGWEITSTNNQQNKDGIIENRRLVCLMQKNKYTEGILENERFMTSKTKAFKVTQIDDTNEEDYSKDFCTMYTLFIEWTPILKDRDNLDLLVADYYDNIYTVKINQEKNIKQEVGFSEKLTATIKKNGEVIDIPILWKTSDNKIVEIDEEGNYSLIGGNVGDKVEITCCIDGNEEIFDTINIEIIDNIVPSSSLEISPRISELKQNFDQEFICNVYINEEKQNTKVDCTPNWIDNHYYELIETDNGWKLKNIHRSERLLELTFSSGSLTETMTIKLGGLF